MLLLTFRAAGNAYCVAARLVVEIVPSVDLRPIPHAPHYLIGLFHFRGTIVPVVDLSALLGSHRCRPSLDTRIIVMEYPVAGQSKAMLGLLAEHVNDLTKVTEDQKVSAAMSLPDAPYLGAIYRPNDILIQTINVGELLPESLRGSLFGEVTEEL